MLGVAVTVGDEEAAFLAAGARLHCLLELRRRGRGRRLEAMADLTDRTQQPHHRWRNGRAMQALLEGAWRRRNAEAAAPWRSAGCGRAST